MRGKIAVIGVGRMGGAIVEGLLGSGLVKPQNLILSDVNRKKLERFRRIGAKIASSGNRDAATDADIILLAVEPQAVDKVLDEIKGSVNEKQIIVSVAACVSAKYIEEKFEGEKIPVIQVMPNTPCLVRAGMIVLFAGKYVSPSQKRKIKKIFDSLGKTLVLDKKYASAVTGLSGCGPAFIYMVIEALTEAGVENGLPEKEALLLAAHTVYGAAKMVLDTGANPKELRRQVTTPGGITIEGVKVLKKEKLKDALKKAIRTTTGECRKRSR